MLVLIHYDWWPIIQAIIVTRLPLISHTTEWMKGLIYNQITEVLGTHLLEAIEHAIMVPSSHSFMIVR